MARKAKQPSINGIGSKGYVFPSYWGLTGKPWSKVEAISEEAKRLHERYLRLGQERQQLLNELDYQRRQHSEAELEAIRKDEDPPEPQYVTKTEQAIARVDTKLTGLRAIGDRVFAEYNSALQEIRGDDALVAELEAKGKQHHQRYLALVAEAENERDRMGDYLGISRFVAGLQDSFGAPPANAVGALWYQQNIQWPSDPPPDPTITSQSAASILG